MQVFFYLWRSITSMKIIVFVIVLLGLVNISVAQILKPVSIPFFQSGVEENKLLLPLNIHADIRCLNATACGLSAPVSPINFKYTLPKGAVFCRMEDAIYS